MRATFVQFEIESITGLMALTVYNFEAGGTRVMEQQQMFHHFVVISITTLLLTLSYWAAINELDDLGEDDLFDSDDD